MLINVPKCVNTDPNTIVGIINGRIGDPVLVRTEDGRAIVRHRPQREAAFNAIERNTCPSIRHPFRQFAGLITADRLTSGNFQSLMGVWLRSMRLAMK